MIFSHLHRAMTCSLLGLAALLSAQEAVAEVYTSAAVADLRFMIEEEKLAGDVYRAFGSLYPTIKPFQNIPKSETTHFNALVSQAQTAGIDVSDLTTLAGSHYANAELQALYSSLVLQGSSSSFAALTVGKNIELKDISDLTAAMAILPTNTSLYTVYGNLRNASNNHLNAFNTWLAVTPAPAVPEPETSAMLLAGLGLLVTLKRRTQRSTAR